jgi:SAM-dependent methyltransferase
MPQTFYTEKEFIEATEEGKDYREMMDCLCRRFRGFGHPNDHSDGKYEYIPMDIKVIRNEIKFVSDILKTKNRIHDLKFLDAGCGIGVTLLVARRYGFKPFGIEFNAKLAEIAVRLSEVWTKDNVFIGDILDYKDYNKFDVIYYYCPFEDRELQATFEKIVENAAKKGAIIIANLKQNDSIVMDKRFKRLAYKDNYEGNQIWQKVAMKVSARKIK